MLFNKDQNFYSSNLESYIENLRKGDLSYLPWIFCVFAENSPSHKLTASQVLNEVLMTFSLDDICRIDRQMRETTSIEWSIDWRSLSVKDFITRQMSEEERRAVLIFSSFNPNGFIRQQAVELLASYEETLPYILLRSNDWVQNVRESALNAFLKKIKTASDEEVVHVFSFADKLRKSGRCDYSSIITILQSKIKANRELLVQGLVSPQLSARRFCISLFSKFPPTDDSLLLTHLEKEKDPLLRRMIFRLLFKSNTDIEQLCEIFLKDKYPANRFMGLRCLCDCNYSLAFAKAEAMLLDKNAQVRILARDIIFSRDRMFDFHTFYLEALPANTPVSIYGLGEVGSMADCRLIEVFLKDTHICVIRAAMISLMRLNPEKYVYCITDLLSSDHAGIVKTSRLLLGKYGNYDFTRVFEIQNSSSDENTKIKCASLLFMAAKWKSLLYTLMLLGSSHEKLETVCQAQINRWISSYNRSYQLVTPDEKKKIKLLIAAKKNSLSPPIEKQLLFLLK